ncbi:ABC transporter substrate-binding protein [Candidatus Dependentiae bacterium]
MKKSTLTASLFVVSLAAVVYMHIGWGNKPSEKCFTVGVSPDYPPFEFKKNGELAGFDIDLAKLLEKELGTKVCFKEMDYYALIPSLKAGHIDMIISSMAPTPEREKCISFSSIYFKSKFAFFFMSKNSVEPSVKKMASKKIGVQTGSTMEQFAKTLDGVHVVSLSSNLILLQELKIGNLDFVLLENCQAKSISEKMPGIFCIAVDGASEVESQGCSVALQKDSPHLVLVNEALKKLEEDGKMKILIKKWFEV